MNRSRRGWLAFALAGLLSALAVGSASAHGNHSSPIQTFVQTVGPYEISVTVELPGAVPAPLNIDITVPPDIGAATLKLRTVPRGQPLDHATVTAVQTVASGPQPVYYTQLTVDRPGDWDLELVVQGSQGGGTARIPFTLTPTPLPPYSVPLLIGLGCLIAFMIATISVSALYNRRRRPALAWLAWSLSRGMLVTLTVVVIFGLLQLDFSVNEARAQASGATFVPAGTMLAAAGRPHANMVVRLDPPQPQIGAPLHLTMNFSDGGTGLPIDDFVTDHDALMHLVVANDDGSFFLHTHPPRVAAGVFAIDLTLTRPGVYTALAEIARIDSGIQVLRASFTVAGSAPEIAAAPGVGTRTIDGLQVSLDAGPTPIKANRQTTLTFSFRNADGPIRDLHPWLGMAGHLLARSDDGAIFAHVHAAEQMPPPGRPIVVDSYAYGPDIRFAYTFPQPGRYYVWGQFKHNGRVLTVPVTLEVH